MSTVTTTKKILAGIAETAAAVALSACTFDVSGFGFGGDEDSSETSGTDTATADPSPAAEASETEDTATTQETETEGSPGASGASAELTAGGEQLQIGATATVQTENYNGAVYTFDVTLAEICDLPAGDVEARTGGPLDVAGDPDFVVDTYQSLDFEITYLGMEGGGGTEFQAVQKPVQQIDPIDSNGAPANSMITSGAETMCGDGSLAELPSTLNDLHEGQTYYAAMMGFSDTTGAGKPAGAEFEYALKSNPSVTGTKFTWR